MGYHDSKYGITQITDGILNHLSISWALDGDPEAKVPVFLFTPDLENKSEHYHIFLNPSQARELNEWLTHSLAETDQQFFKWWKENTLEPCDEAAVAEAKSKAKSRSRKRF